jgi:hypothetical protein
MREKHSPAKEPIVPPPISIPKHVDALRGRLMQEAERWVNECGPDFTWTTADVIDFAEIVYRRLSEGSKANP